MIEVIDQGKKIVEPVIVYLGATIHYMIQISGLGQFEGAMNVIVGILVGMYTMTKLIDWAISKRKSYIARKDAEKRN